VKRKNHHLVLTSEQNGLKNTLQTSISSQAIKDQHVYDLKSNPLVKLHFPINVMSSLNNKLDVENQNFNTTATVKVVGKKGKSRSDKHAKKDIAFLIEGFGVRKPNRFREVEAGINLAKANGCVFFDPISFLDVTHFSEALKGTSERAQITLVLFVFSTTVEIDPGIIFDIVIKPTFRHLVEKGYLKSIPKWIASLNSYEGYSNFCNRMFDIYFHRNKQLYHNERRKVMDKLLTLSNLISQGQFINFLNKHPKITTVYGLIGSKHLKMLDSIGQIILKENKYVHVQVNIKNKIVNVYLFGGQHNESMHYEKMEAFAKKAGLIVPNLSGSHNAKVEVVKVLRSLQELGVALCQAISIF